MIDQFILDLYKKQVELMFPDVLRKDIYIDLSRTIDSLWCDINFYYRNELIYNCKYNLENVLLYSNQGKMYPDANVKTFKELLKDKIYDQYIHSISDKKE